MTPDVIASKFKSLGFETIETETVDYAMSIAENNSGEQSTIIGTGSLFVASEIRELVLDIPQETYPVFTHYSEGKK